MGDGIKISKDKRHRSSSSLAAVVLEGTCSERKLDFRASIPEVDDQFALAEARCNDLQEKIDLVKVLKRKRKLKKRSMTKINDPPPTDNVPFISVRTQPKKKVSQQAARMRRLEIPQNPTRGYLDPATVEQHRMLGQVRCSHPYKQPLPEQTKEYAPPPKPYKSRAGRTRAEGDGVCGQGVQISTGPLPLEVACGQDEFLEELSDSGTFDRQDEFPIVNHSRAETRQQLKAPTNRRRHVPRDTLKEVPKWSDETNHSKSGFRGISSPTYRRPQPPNRERQNLGNHLVHKPSEERPVVELFNKSRANPLPDLKRQTHLSAATTDKRTRKVNRESEQFDDQATGPLENVTSTESNKESHRHPRRVKYRSRRYELPTVASQMKQAGMRYYYGNANHTNIPFVVSKSTAPSHNIGVNIQQVLNGLKIQQPLSGIPPTIAHHMGLGHVPTHGTKSAPAQQSMSLDNGEINVIKLGARMLRLPSYKYMSYSRLLSLYREGDGMVPRFLRAISRPHYFYTSMYNLATNHEDLDCATSKGRAGSQDAKQSLAEYASLYREYEQIEKTLRETYEPELERRKNELARELAAREDHIRKVVQDFRAPSEAQPVLRASASTAEEVYRHSTYKLNGGDQM